MNRLQRLQEAGVWLYLDTLSSELLESGEFEQPVRDYVVTGIAMPVAVPGSRIRVSVAH